MNQLDLFTGLALKDSGMTRAAEAKPELLARARSILVRLAINNGECTADDLPEDMRVALGPAMGSLFKGGMWVFTGKRKVSHLVSNHGRELKVWRLK